MPAYQFRLPDSGGTYITDARTIAEAQAELCEFFMRPVLVVNIDSDRVPDVNSGDDKNVSVLS